MKDPVTVATGITYDRESIQRWKSYGQHNTCPVTNQLLPQLTGFTPNHNLRRLIESWSDNQVLQTSNHSTLFHVKVTALNLIKNLKLQDKSLQLESLKSIEKLVMECEKNRVCFKEFGVVKVMVSIVVSCHQNCEVFGLKEALNVLYLVRLSQDETHSDEHDRIISSLTWVLDLDASSCDCNDTTNVTYMSMKFHAMVLLKDIIDNAKSHVLERLNRDFFKTIVLFLQKQKSMNLDQNGVIKEVIHVMLSTCTWPRNSSMMIELGAVFELVEIELESSPKKAITELTMGVLFHLCSLADGRAQLIGHAAGIAMVTKRIGKVSRKVDERALMIISMISKYSATNAVLQEMMRVGTVEKLCMVLQVNDHNSYQREKARDILKRHSNVWKDSPCLNLTLLTS
ncbi:E3 ubiquitin-protein ligase PUB24-like [Rutidosis leptorrhynchoides]|uniref:E3 ubiquitin-protein ligase PUB24-like n=1 Tax=Rutidosis leptorrhynchoides TaxID=125765 RepID=UPI003A98EFAF